MTALTTIIATKNEEMNLRAAIASVSWVDQVMVVDSGSTDRTVEIARDMGAEVLDFVYDGDWPKKRNWAIAHSSVRNPWILILDADERVSEASRVEIEAAISKDNVAGYYLRWKFVFLGRWMKHCWSHGWMLRLFRRGEAAYEDLGMRGEGGWDAEVHENIVSEGMCGRLHEPLLHESEQSLAFWIDKQNQFSTWNAKRRLSQLQDSVPSVRWLVSKDPVRRRKYLKAVFLRLPCKPVLLFIYLYVWKLGFLDGRPGYYFCMLRAAHELSINAKMFESESVDL